MHATNNNNTPKQQSNNRETEREMPKLSSSSFLSWPGTMALCRWTAVLLLVFGLAVVWQFGGGGPGAGLEGAWVGKAKATTSRFP